ncbi:MAG: type I DNA topoisomerase [Acidaminococcaceae bacterium]|jgi:DNA topoisomerase-1|nr:type I DNA topoisomerase [Acidaminococcaceae bacterium]
MANNLIIVESPTKSKTIAKFLPKTYAVTASMGHLRDLPKSSFGVDLEHDFEPKYINIRGKGDLIKDLKTKAKNAKKIYLATDPDREGEAISWHLAFLLGLDSKAVCRIEFHEITESAVKNALKNARTIDMDMVDAQQARRIIDRIVGYKLSPLLWRKVRKGLSAGRVQSVAVKIIADREKEIKAFEPEEYWTLQVKLRQDAKAPIFAADVVKFKNEKLALHNAAETLQVEQALAKAAYKVEEAVRKDVRRRPLPPFTTSSLQQEAGRKLNFTTKKTMIVAQQLYEGINVGKGGSVGLITYMRTDSVRMANEARVSIRDHIKQVFGAAYCPEKANFFATRQSAQDAHEAIRPTAVERTPAELERYLSKDQYKLYKLIWNRAVASQMAEAVYENTTLTISGGEYGLRASGSILKFDGYLKLADKKEQGDSREVPYIPAPSPLELYKVVPGEQHFTEPPAHYTEAALVKELEEKGIGRPSTYAPIIQTIQDRGYVVREGKKLLVTELGQTVVDLLTQYFKEVINIPFSAQLETELDEIAEHKEDKLDILKKFYDPFSKLLKVAEVAIPKVDLPVEVSDVKCEKCGRMMVVKEGRYGKFLACPGFPACRNTKPILVKAGVTCPDCGGDVIVRKTKTGRIFYGCSNYPTCKFTSWDKPSATEKCPECGHYMVEHQERGGKIKLYCSNVKCPNALPRHTVRHKVTTASILGVKHVVKKRRAAKSTRKKAGTTTAKKRTGTRTGAKA